MDILQMLADELAVRKEQVRAAVELMDEGCTVPFIARYRKEKTGSLDDETLRKLAERLAYLRSLQERKEQVLRAIEEQGKLTAELKKEIEEAQVLVRVEDLYRPFKQKRRTRAMIAKERGLQPLADLIMLQMMKNPIADEAASYVDEEKGVPDVQAAIAGASDIIAEAVSDDASLRDRVRELAKREGLIISEEKESKETKKAKTESEEKTGRAAAGVKTAGNAKSSGNGKQASVYETYYHYEESVSKIPGYRVLALDRGEKEEQLAVHVQLPDERILAAMEKRVIRRDNPQTTPVLKAALKDGYERLIKPSIEREIRTALTEKAQEGAIDVFGKNLKQLLMQPPVSGHTVLGWDPAFRTGCKLAVVDETGKVLDTAVIFPTAPTTPAKMAAAEDVLRKLISRYHITLVSMGNGTASRESEQFLAALLAKIPEKVQYVIVSEAGASVYSASELATKEFPQFDVGQRSAASIARRLQDPLAELVKIDPKSIGVGQYQHDMNQKRLGEALGGVVESCVNQVGVDLNTASASLLTYVSGLSASVAANIVAYREENGRFRDRRDLKKVKGLGPKAFIQAAGFLRIKDGVNPLDQTGVHPESYQAAADLLGRLGLSLADLKNGALTGITKKAGNLKKMAQELGIGEPTLADILQELEKPGRDPREQLPRPVLRSDVLDMKDLKPGMVLKGTVRNVIDFGAFVDIGVHQDGLVHISQLTSGKFVRHPLEVVSVGDVVEVKVLQVDEKRGRISLTMII